MRPGDLVWFDSFYHKGHYNDMSPSEYSLQGVIIKKYSTEEKYEILGEANFHMLKNSALYDIMVDGKIYIAPCGTLVSVNRQEEII